MAPKIGDRQGVASLKSSVLAALADGTKRREQTGVNPKDAPQKENVTGQTGAMKTGAG